MSSNQDQPNATKRTILATHTSKFIRQQNRTVELGEIGKDFLRRNTTIQCKTRDHARRLALELAGLKVSRIFEPDSAFRRIASHPWRGILVFESFRETNAESTILVVRDSSEWSPNEIVAITANSELSFDRELLATHPILHFGKLLLSTAIADE